MKFDKADKKGIYEESVPLKAPIILLATERDTKTQNLIGALNNRGMILDPLDAGHFISRKDKS